MACFNSPLGPLTVIVLSVPTVTVIPLGMTTGFFPILDISRNLNNYNSNINSLIHFHFQSYSLPHFHTVWNCCVLVNVTKYLSAHVLCFCIFVSHYSL